MRKRPSERSASTGKQCIQRWRRGVKALVTSSQAVLLVRERRTNGCAFWTLPGGGVRAGETSAEALRREIREELQCGSVVGPPTGAFTYVHSSRPEQVSRYEVLDCAVTGTPVPNESEGVLQCRWVCPKNPPAGTLPQVESLLQSRLAGSEVATAKTG